MANNKTTVSAPTETYVYFRASDSPLRFLARRWAPKDALGGLHTPSPPLAIGNPVEDLCTPGSINATQEVVLHATPPPRDSRNVHLSFPEDNRSLRIAAASPIPFVLIGGDEVNVLTELLILFLASGLVVLVVCTSMVVIGFLSGELTIDLRALWPWRGTSWSDAEFPGPELLRILEALPRSAWERMQQPAAVREQKRQTRLQAQRYTLPPRVEFGRRLPATSRTPRTWRLTMIQERRDEEWREEQEHARQCAAERYRRGKARRSWSDESTLVEDKTAIFEPLPPSLQRFRSLSTASSSSSASAASTNTITSTSSNASSFWDRATLHSRRSSMSSIEAVLSLDVSIQDSKPNAFNTPEKKKRKTRKRAATFPPLHPRSCCAERLDAFFTPPRAGESDEDFRAKLYARLPQRPVEGSYDYVIREWEFWFGPPVTDTPAQVRADKERIKMFADAERHRRLTLQR